MLASAMYAKAVCTGQRQLKSQPDITEELWEKMRNGDHVEDTAGQKPATSSVEFVYQTATNTFEKAKNVFTRSPFSSSPRKNSAPPRIGVFQSVWGRHRADWKLPEPSRDVLESAANAVEFASRGTSQKRKASKSGQSSRSQEKRRQKS
jgi:hypothetical protein